MSSLICWNLLVTTVFVICVFNYSVIQDFLKIIPAFLSYVDAWRSGLYFFKFFPVCYYEASRFHGDFKAGFSGSFLCGRFLWNSWPALFLLGTWGREDLSLDSFNCLFVMILMSFLCIFFFPGKCMCPINFFFLMWNWVTDWYRLVYHLCEPFT